MFAPMGPVLMKQMEKKLEHTFSKIQKTSGGMVEGNPHVELKEKPNRFGDNSFYIWTTGDGPRNGHDPHIPML